MKVIWIMVGLPGSGKSLLSELLETRGCVVVSADHYFMRDGQYEFDREKLSEAHVQCQRLCREAMEQGQEVVVDNTNCSYKERSKYHRLAREFGYTIKEVQITVPLEFCINNCKHNVPLDVMQSRQRTLANCPPLIEL